MKHGSYSTYSNHACRCEACTEAWRQYQTDLRLRRIERPIPDTVPHGKASTYCNWGCRCGPCVAAKAEQHRQYLTRKRREATA